MNKNRIINIFMLFTGAVIYSNIIHLFEISTDNLPNPSILNLLMCAFFAGILLFADR